MTTEPNQNVGPTERTEIEQCALELDWVINKSGTTYATFTKGTFRLHTSWFRNGIAHQAKLSQSERVLGSAGMPHTGSPGGWIREVLNDPAQFTPEVLLEQTRKDYAALVARVDAYSMELRWSAPDVADRLRRILGER